ncbi:Hypothetical predicted protein [Podarcis lilfordi]|uniref:Uncharacterized protein n=1 Tax=Podarcis lilfordi TaxID=74358 RepID=A0AA35KK92_9SAUR|nr:Hypothetical predicted protein [Podarcis lilfordi]
MAALGREPLTSCPDRKCVRLPWWRRWGLAGEASPEGRPGLGARWGGRDSWERAWLEAQPSARVAGCRREESPSRSRAHSCQPVPSAELLSSWREREGES